MVDVPCDGGGEGAGDRAHGRALEISARLLAVRREPVLYGDRVDAAPCRGGVARLRPLGVGVSSRVDRPRPVPSDAGADARRRGARRCPRPATDHDDRAARAARLLGAAGVGMAYALSALLVTVSLTTLTRLRSPKPEAGRAGIRLQAIREGLGFVWRSEVILGCMALDMFAVIFGGASALLPIYAT